MTKEFILKSLLPYKNNPETCGYDGTNCVYITNDGTSFYERLLLFLRINKIKKCAIGQYMKPGPWQYFKGSASSLFDYYEENEIMTDEWLSQNISHDVANSMQNYHDTLARNNGIDNYHLQKLERYTGFKLDELR